MYVPLDVYHRGLSAMASLQEAGHVRVIVARQVQFELVDDSSLPSVGMTLDEFDDFTYDLADVLLAALSSTSAEVFAERRSKPRDELATDETENNDVAREKFDATSAALDITELRARRWLKRSSQHDIPHALDWEIVDKNPAATSSRNAPDRPIMRAGVLSLVTESMGHRFLPQFNSVTMTVDMEDLNFMIDRLTTMRDTWQKLDADA